VAVLGTTGRRDTLFGDVDPVGQIIRIRNQPFRVIGVMASKGQSAMGQDQDDVIFTPYTTVRRSCRASQFINNITVSAASADSVSRSPRHPRAAAVRHKIMPGDNDDFMVRTLEEMAAVRTETTRTMTALLAAIAGVSLLVGGIGIMNIMLVSVTERTREIGLRMAIGARGKDVLMQFLVEAIVSACSGAPSASASASACRQRPSGSWSGRPPSRRTPSGWRSGSRRRRACSSGSIPPARRRGWIRSKRCGSSNSGLRRGTSEAGRSRGRSG
jgi:putative ABC transport system permease protein